MQDSLEDYIRISSNTKQSQPQDINAFKETCERKKKCEDYAFKIVEFMMEGKLQPQIFLKSICFINQEHYQDVVEERAITKLCGYPLCGKKLPPMPNKQYFISNKQNKVFDITERKNFCSNYCYQASCHVKEQIDTSPLWLRKPEDFPEIKLMNDSSKVSPGVEISTTVKPDDTPDPQFTSVASFTELCLDEAEELENDPENDDCENENIEVIETDSTDKPKSILKKPRKKVQVSKKYDEVAKNELNSKWSSDNGATRKCVKFDALQERISYEDMNALRKGTSEMSMVDRNINAVSETSTNTKIVAHETSEMSTNINAVQHEKSEISLDDENIVKHEAKDKNISATAHETSEVSPKNTDIDAVNRNKNEFSLKGTSTSAPKQVKDETNKANPKKSIIGPTNNAHHKNIKGKPIATSSKKSDKEEVPKCAVKLIEKIKCAEKVDRNVEELVEKVKRMEISRRKTTDEDEKMRRVLEKLKGKKVKTKRPIIIDTLGNPEAKLEELKAEEVVKKVVKGVPVDKIRTVVLSWLTLETLSFLHGEEKVKEALSEDVLGDYFDKLKVAELETERQIRYLNICKRLRLREMAEEKFEEAALDRRYRPPPDFTRLKEESKDMNLKVRAFYTGALYEKDDPNFKTPKQEQPEEIPTVLPVVETGHQNALRKKIFINSATKYVQTHVMELSLQETVTAEVQELAKTFKLEADNITFKPATWNIIGLVLIYILSVKDAALKDRLKMDHAVTYKDAILNCDGVLDEILESVTDVNVFVEKHVTR